MDSPKPEHIQIFAAHSIATLPENIQQRKLCLGVLKHLLPRNNTHRGKVVEMLLHLNAEAKIQQEFIFARDGHHHGKDGQ